MTYRWQDVLDADGDFYVPSDLWQALNASMTQDAIIDLFQEAVENTGMPFPFREIPLEVAVGDFKRLRYFNAGDLVSVGPWKTGYDYRYGKSDVSLKQSNVGLISSDYFHQQHRRLCDNNTRGAGAKAWQSKATRREIFKPLWTMKMTQVTPREIRSCSGLRTYVAAQFRPTVAKYIYERFGGGRVLDFSAGWGDRLSAALATNVVTHYTGIDPNTNLHPGYQSQIQAYNRNLDGDFFDWFGEFTLKTIHMIHSPAEDADLSGEGMFDLVFTSPPYFDKEYYSEESTQSYIRYPTSDGWLSGFLFPVLQKVWGVLKPGGHLCVNIVDIKNFNPTRRVEICDPMNDFVGGLPGARYRGSIGMKMKVRPNLDSEEFCEPIWVWQKE